MRRKLIIFLLLLITFFTACVTPLLEGENVVPYASSIMPQIATSPPLSVVDLLAQALSRYQAGDYEEAILIYLAIIEIEPKNFDAQLGLGQAYRQNKQPDKAIVPLKEALNLRLEDRSTAIELGYAYLDIGEYAETEKLARELLGDRMPDLSPMPTPDFEERETLSESVSVSSLNDEVGEVLTLLLLSFGGQDKVEEMQTLLNNEAFYKHLNKTVSVNNVLYVGQYNSEGKREGKGVGIYPFGCIYFGEYMNNVRSGQGKYVTSVDIFEGEWADDAPNGYGRHLTPLGGLQLEGTYIDGIEHGTFTVAWGNQRGTMTSINGKREVIAQVEPFGEYGSRYDVWVFGSGSDASSRDPDFIGIETNYNYNDMDNKPYGIYPWAMHLGWSGFGS